MSGQGRPQLNVETRTSRVRWRGCAPRHQPSIGRTAAWLCVCAALLPAETTEATPSDARLFTQQKNLIFDPGESFHFQLQLSLPEYVIGRFLDVKIQLQPASGGQAVWDFEEKLQVPLDGKLSKDFTIDLPEMEAAYELAVTAAPPRAFQRFGLGGRPKLLINRSFELVVLGKTPPAPNNLPRSWREIGLFEPTNPRWWQRLPSWTQLHRLSSVTRHGTSGSTEPQLVQLEHLSFVKLPPPDASSAGGPHWQAYALPVQDLGRPHQVEIEYLSNTESQLAFTILQPNTGSHSFPEEATVFQDQHATVDEPPLQKHRLLFWPRSRSPVLLISNAHRTIPAHFGKIRVLAGPARLSPRKSNAAPQNQTRQRLVAMYISQSSLLQQPAAEDPRDGKSETTNAFQQTSLSRFNQLTDYLHYGGYNAAILPIRSQSDSQAEISPRRQTGETGQPGYPQLDQLELALRIFERQGLTLIPAIGFEKNTDTDVRDLLSRYGNYKSLGGLGLRLSGPELLRKFAGNRTQATRDFRQLAEQIQKTGSRRRLILTTEDLFSGPDIEPRLRPNLLEKTSLQPLLQDLAIDPAALAKIPSLVLLRPQFESPAAPLVDRATDLQINRGNDFLQLTDEESLPGLLIYHRNRANPLAEVDREPLPLGESAHLPSTTQFVPHGAASRRSLVTTLASRDVEVLVNGGTRPLLAEQESMRELRRMFSMLPGNPTEIEVKREQPITLRSYRRSNDTTTCIINQSRWPVATQVTVNVPKQTAITFPHRDGQTPGNDRLLNKGSHALRFELAPYAMQAVRFSNAHIELTGVQVEISPDAKEQLSARIEDLTRRELTNEENGQYRVLTNPGIEAFGEEPSTEPLSGWWTLNPLGTAEITYSELSPFKGRTCLLLKSTGNAAGVQSHDFAIPATGQLALTAHFCGRNIDPKTELRIVFESLGKPHYRQLTVLGGSTPSALPINEEWTAYAFSVEDLPLNSNAKMYIRFELLGAGEVSIDNVSLQHLLFPLDYYPASEYQRYELLKKISAAESALRKGHLTNCEHLLDGYWPRFVEEYLPTPESSGDDAAPQIADQNSEPTTPIEDSNPPPSLSERLRELLWF
jgi:hypothetical protein